MPLMFENLVRCQCLPDFLALFSFFGVTVTSLNFNYPS